MDEIIKTLSKNDVGETGGHQAGFYVLKDNWDVLKPLDFKKENDSYKISVEDEENEYFTWNVRWYSSKSEVHITGCREFYDKCNVISGDTLKLVKIDEQNYKVSINSISAGMQEQQQKPEKKQGQKQSLGKRYSSDPEYRKHIEEYSMKMAIEHYSESGVVKDTSQEYPYDLEVDKEGHLFTVEVKGTASSGEKIILTRNEVAHNINKHPDTALFIVKNIKVNRNNGNIVCSGGEKVIIKPWKPEEGTLSPTQYEYTVPQE